MKEAEPLIWPGPLHHSGQPAAAGDLSARVCRGLVNQRPRHDSRTCLAVDGEPTLVEAGGAGPAGKELFFACKSNVVAFIISMSSPRVDHAEIN